MLPINPAALIVPSLATIFTLPLETIMEDGFNMTVFPLLSSIPAFKLTFDALMLLSEVILPSFDVTVISLAR